MSNRVRSRHEHPDQLQGRHVLAMILAFFGVVFAVNGYFLASALTTYTGVVASEPYRKGLAYNIRIAADERQSQLGWQDAIGFTRAGDLVLTLSDQAGAPVRGLAVSGTIARPSTARHDRAVRFIENAMGLYAANIDTLASGSWIVSIKARLSAMDDEPVYRSRRRLWLKS